MSSDERSLRLGNAIVRLAELNGNQEQRVTRLEEIASALAQFVTLSNMTESHHDSIDEPRAAQAESERKIAALADAQAHTDRRLDALIDIVRNERDGQSPSS